MMGSKQKRRSSADCTDLVLKTKKYILLLHLRNLRPPGEAVNLRINAFSSPCPSALGACPPGRVVNPLFSALFAPANLRSASLRCILPLVIIVILPAKGRDHAHQ